MSDCDLSNLSDINNIHIKKALDKREISTELLQNTKQ